MCKYANVKMEELKIVKMLIHCNLHICTFPNFHIIFS